MNKVLFCVILFGLCACDDSNQQQETLKKAEIERAQVLTNIEKKITPEERKQDFAKRMFDL